MLYFIVMATKSVLRQTYKYQNQVLNTILKVTKLLLWIQETDQQLFVVLGCKWPFRGLSLLYSVSAPVPHVFKLPYALTPSPKKRNMIYTFIND